MAKSKTLLNIHARQYIAEVFQERLIAEGFKCPDDKLLCWYRVRNQQILDTVIFCTNWTGLPVELDMLYESAPLFFHPIYNKSVLYYDSFNARTDYFRRELIIEGNNIDNAQLCMYSMDILVYASLHGARGLYTLTDVALPYFESIQTISDCYLHSKAEHRPFVDEETGEVEYGWMSPEFVDLVLYENDPEFYGICKNQIPAAIQYYEKLTAEKPKNQEYANLLQCWKALHPAFFDGGREAYLAILEQRKQRNISYLREKLGVQF